MYKGLVLYSFMILSSHLLLGQVKPMKGSWIRARAENIDSTRHFNPFDPQNRYYGRIDFLENHQLQFANSPYDTKKPIKYKLGSKQLEFNHTRYSIYYRSDTLLILDEKSAALETKVPKKRFHYYEESYILEKYKTQLGDLGTSIQDTLKLKPIVVESSSVWSSFNYQPQLHLNSVSNYMPLAQFNHPSENFETFFQKAMKHRVFNKPGKSFTIQITVSEKSKISYIEVLESDNETMAQELVKIFRKSSSFWKARTIGGSRTWMKIIFPIVIDRTIIDPKQANELLGAGNELYSHGNYESSVEKYTEALKFDHTNNLIIYNRSMAYHSLANLEKACQDWYTIYKTGEMATYEFLKHYCDMK